MCYWLVDTRWLRIYYSLPLTSYFSCTTVLTSFMPLVPKRSRLPCLQILLTMRPPAASPLADIGFDCSNAELFESLVKMIGGLPLPGNVIPDANPYNYEPSNLPYGIWYLIHSKENANAGHGFWKVKGVARLFSDADINGWRTTFEFFKGRAPNAVKTDWLMYEYWISKKGLDESTQEGSSLCRVFLAGELDLVQQNGASSHNSSNALHQSKQSTSIGGAHNSSSCCRTSKPEVSKDDDSGTFFLTGRPLDHRIEDLPEIDYIDDYLELQDFDDQASPSSSGNSSCLTMSSDECFDSLALLRELEAEELPSQEPVQKVDHCKFSVSDECFDSLALLRELEAEELPSQEPVQKVDHCKFSVSASVKSDKVVVLPDSPAGLSVHAEESNLPSEELIRTLLPGSTKCDSKDADNKGKRQPTVRKEEVHRRDQSPLNPHEVGPSSRRQNASPSEEKRDARGKLKKKLKRKYLCFMPFYAFF